MASNYYWEKFLRSGKISDYLAYRHPDTEIIRHYPKNDASEPPDNER